MTRQKQLDICSCLLDCSVDGRKNTNVCSLYDVLIELRSEINYDSLGVATESRQTLLWFRSVAYCSPRQKVTYCRKLCYYDTSLSSFVYSVSKT